MTQFLGALLLTGVLGYIPYKYLTMIGLVSEKKQDYQYSCIIDFFYWNMFDMVLYFYNF